MAALAGISLSAATVEFNRDVRPLLSDRCFACHGPDAAARGIKLRLDSEAAAKADLGGRFAIVSGDVAKSELVRRITAPKPALRMPPVHSGLKLTDAEIDALKTWIAEGAEWQKHWSFIAPVRPAVPDNGQPGWGTNPIDAFVMARLKREQLTPSVEAPKATLIRRASLDITGLPPAPEEVEAFEKDSSPDAYEKLLDRLFESPRYGERMASRWLDAARYADTNGYQTDAEREMWRWRDWVIEAFNRNQPFDQFMVEQIAGDLLPDATLSQKIATGFNRNHRGNSEGGIVPEEYLVEYAVDRVETMSTVFLGVTMGCARCHTHKYDPFTQTEFYSLLAYFNNIPELGRYLKYGNTPPYVKAPTPEQQTRLQALDAQITKARKAFERAESENRETERKWIANLAANAEFQPEDGMVASAPAYTGTVVVQDGGETNFGFLSKFTLAAWVEPRDVTGPVITRAIDDENGEGYGLYLEDGKLQANFIKRRLDDSIRVQSKAKLKSGERAHVALTYDGSRVATGVRLYVNGESQEVEIILDAINQDFAVKEPLRVGAGGSAGRKFAGVIDRSRVYGRALESEEIRVLATPAALGSIARRNPRDRSPFESLKMRRAYLETGPISNWWKALESARRERLAYLESVPTVMVMEELPQPKETFLLQRGVYDKPGERVERNVPASLHPLPAGAPANRLGLAKWLADPANALTARVTVNRFWQMLFGTGIVKTVEDFGVQGEWPSHPELLDWLAVEFVESGWDVKKLLKTIMMSSTYRQTSNVSPVLEQRDPENRLLARGARMRLPAEVIRDQALFAAGLLVDQIGGPSAKPYQPAGLWSELGTADYVPDTGDGLYRRSLYTFWKRTAAPPFMANFDSAMRESCTVRETRTDTPLQALNLMNDVTFVEAARNIAQRVLLERRESDRLRYAFRLILVRQPSPAEQETLRGSLGYYRDYFAGNPERADSLLSQGSSKRKESLDRAEHAAWTAVSSMLLNTDEAITKE